MRNRVVFESLIHEFHDMFLKSRPQDGTTLVKEATRNSSLVLDGPLKRLNKLVDDFVGEAIAHIALSILRQVVVQDQPSHDILVGLLIFELQNLDVKRKLVEVNLPCLQVLLKFVKRIVVLRDQLQLFFEVYCGVTGQA